MDDREESREEWEKELIDVQHGVTFADELRQAADDEAQLRNRLEAVVAGMGEALVAVDSNGRLTTFNRAAEDLVGKPATAALGRELAELAQP